MVHLARWSVRELEYCYSGIAWAIGWDLIKAIDIGVAIDIRRWWLYGGGAYMEMVDLWRWSFYESGGSMEVVDL